LVYLCRGLRREHTSSLRSPVSGECINSSSSMSYWRCHRGYYVPLGHLRRSNACRTDIARSQCVTDHLSPGRIFAKSFYPLTHGTDRGIRTRRLVGSCCGHLRCPCPNSESTGDRYGLRSGRLRREHSSLKSPAFSDSVCTT